MAKDHSYKDWNFGRMEDMNGMRKRLDSLSEGDEKVELGIECERLDALYKKWEFESKWPEKKYIFA